MNIKIYKKKNTRGSESFINKLDTKRSNLPLDDAKVFTFPLNLCQDCNVGPKAHHSSFDDD